jgi:hypothetical protein
VPVIGNVQCALQLFIVINEVGNNKRSASFLYGVGKVFQRKFYVGTLTFRTEIDQFANDAQDVTTTFFGGMNFSILSERK